MCGFFGIFENNKINIKLANQSFDLLSSRGPDESNTYQENNIFFGHKRLSIIDDKNGKQPMFSDDKKIILLYNGEIYNYKSLINEYNYNFKTNSDTEVLLAGYQLKGISFVEDLRGMFSFVIFDKNINKLFLVRDDIGIKPLVYYHSEDKFIFSSEVKSIKNYLKDVEIDHLSVNEFFARRFIPAPKTIYKKIRKLNKNTILELDLFQNIYSCRNYNKSFTKIKINKKNYKEEIKRKIKETVQKHLIADVPISLMLSGGVDSSILAKVCKDIGANITSYTLATKKDKLNPDQDYQYAKAVNKKLEIKNKFIYVDKIKDTEIIDIIKYLDDPYCDPAFISSAILLKEISKNYKVALSGDGADELFYGYHSYQKIASPKFPLKNNLDLSFLYLFSIRIKKIINYFENNHRNNYTYNYYGVPLNVLTKIFKNEINLSPKLPKNPDQVNSRNYDLEVNLPDYYLNRLDKAGMKNSVEVRVPFCDVELFDLINQFDYQDHTENINGVIRGKRLLRKIYENDLPEKIFTRTKQGFKRNLIDIIGKKNFNKLFNELVTKEIFEVLNISTFYQKTINKFPNSMVFQLKWRLLVFSIWYHNNYIKSL